MHSPLPLPGERDTRRLTPRSLDRLEAAPRRRRRRRGSRVARAAADLRVGSRRHRRRRRRSAASAISERGGAVSSGGPRTHLAEAVRLRLWMLRVSLAPVAVVVVGFLEPVSARVQRECGLDDRILSRKLCCALYP
jgi:hypothetical protein